MLDQVAPSQLPLAFDHLAQINRFVIACYSSRLSRGLGPARSGLGALDGRFPSFDECGQTFLLLVENILSTLL
jgi:hypothetical protein